MTLEALLTFFGILIAVLAVVRPVQRHSLALFAPTKYLLVSIALSFVLIVWRDMPLGISPPYGWPLPMVLFVLTLVAFLIPVATALWCWSSWYNAMLKGNRINRVVNVFEAALRESEFDEVERIVRRNQQRLHQLPPNASAVLFDPGIVAALINSHSFVHLELLANMNFLKSLEDRYAAVDAVVRELLTSTISPLRSAVVAQYGGLEHFRYSNPEQKLIEKTFQNPEWYFEANAHFPLVIAAIEVLRTGKLDIEYNEVGRDYEADQGTSKRSRCPIYLAVKTEVLAIQAAITAKSEKDFYVSDLLDIFRAVQERSKYGPAWQSPLSNHEFPTPYAYLMYEIAGDLRNLSAEAVQAATTNGITANVSAPGRIAHDLAQNWSFCLWSIAGSQSQMHDDFRSHIIKRYLQFILALGWGPSEVYPGSVGTVQELLAWRDLFMRELKEKFNGDTKRTAVLQGAVESLDYGKQYISNGHKWLVETLFN